MKKFIGPVAILIAGIGGITLGITAAQGSDSPTITHYEDGSFTVDYHDGSAPAIGYLPDSTAAND